MAKTVKDYIRTIVDFPHEGILFRDVTTLFADPRGFRMCVDQLLAPYAGMRIDKVAGLEARGFTGAELARVTCPIGLPGITGKEPEVIAVSVAAQLLQSRPLQAGT